MAAKKQWTPEDDQALSRLYCDEDLTISEVAEKMGLHRQQVMRRAKTLKLVRSSGRVWTEDETRFLKSRLQDLGYEGVAKALGKTAEAVRLISRRLDLPSPQPRENCWTDEETQKIVARLYEGYTYSEISLEIDRTADAIRYRCKSVSGLDMDAIRKAQRERKVAQRKAGGEPRRWTARELGNLIVMAEKGLLWREVGEKLGRTPEACRFQWKRMTSGELCGDYYAECADPHLKL